MSYNEPYSEANHVLIHFIGIICTRCMNELVSCLWQLSFEQKRVSQLLAAVIYKLEIPVKIVKKTIRSDNNLISIVCLNLSLLSSTD